MRVAPRWFPLVLFAILMGSVPVRAFARQGRVYAFGDSLLDDGTIFRTTGSTADAGPAPLYSGRNFSNGVTAFDHFGRLTGLRADPADDHAVSGVFSGLNSSTQADYPGTLAQVRAFVAGGGRFSPEDVAIVDGGTNDLGVIGRPGARVPNGLTMPVTASQVAAYVGSSLSDAVSLLKEAGLTTAFVYNVPVASDGARAINAEVAAMAKRSSDRGIRVEVFDLLGLYEAVKADPARYGFVSGAGCSASADCSADPGRFENRHFTVEGLHPTTAGHEVIARYLAKLYVATRKGP